MQRLRRSWRNFGEGRSEGRAGHRFRERYRRRQRSGGSRLSRILALSGGVALALAGLAMLVLPGPGWLVFFLGLGILAGEFLVLARFLDRAEAGSRKLLRRLARLHGRHPSASWSVAVSLALVCALALGYGGYVFFYAP